MIDPLAVIVAALKANTTVNTMASGRIYAAKYLPQEYSVEKGPAVLISIRGGSQDYSSHVHSPSLQIRSFGASELEAQSMSGVVYDALNDSHLTGMLYCQMEDGTYPVAMRDPETGWDFVLSFYKMHMHQS